MCNIAVMRNLFYANNSILSILYRSHSIAHSSILEIVNIDIYMLFFYILSRSVCRETYGITIFPM